MNNTEDIEEVLTPPRIREIAQTVRDDALPSKSKEKYEKAYLDFGKWEKKENTAVTSENVLIAYFKALLEKFKPTTLWATYSMLKSTISLVTIATIPPLVHNLLIKLQKINTLSNWISQVESST